MQEARSQDATNLEEAPRSHPGRTAFLVAVAVAIGAMSLQEQIDAVLPREAAGPRGRGASAAVVKQIDLTARFAVFAAKLLGEVGGPWGQEKEFRSQMADWLVQAAEDEKDPRLYRRAGIVGMWLDPAAERYQSFEQAVRIQEPRDPESAALEQSLWKALYERDDQERASLTPEQWQRFEPVVAELEPDPWYRDLVRLRAARLLEQQERVSALEQSVYAAARSRVVPVALAIGGLLVGTFIGAVGGIVVLVLFASGYIKVAGIPRGLPVRPLWETVIIYFLLHSGLSVAVGFLAKRLGLQLGPMNLVLISLMIQALSAGSLVWLLTARPSIKLADVGWSLRRVPGDILYGIAGYLVTLPLLALAVGVALQLMRLLPEAPPPSHPAVERMLNQPPSAGLLIGMFIMVSVMAPLVEELLFRGVMQSALRQRCGAAASIIVSSLIFALVHPQGPLAVPTLFLLGAAFATLREIRGSVLPGMVAHAINNGVVLFVLMG